jgi:membrane protease subunit (stomatin/prohibitin family)
MGFFDNIRKEVGNQFIEVIQWLDDSGDAMTYRFPVVNQEIKMGAQLTVRENQAALFINEGKATDLFGPGRYELTTQNMPVMTVLRGWKYGFQSPFKAEVYFFNTKTFTDLKWGTPNPVMMRDADFGMIRLRAFGSYAMKIVDPKLFFQTVVGTQGLTTTDEIVGQLRSIIVSSFSDAVAEAKIPALDLAAKYEELATVARNVITPHFASFGIEVSRFYIENISLPEEVEAAIDQRSRIGVLGDHMNQYAQMQSADAIKIAAANPGGLAGAGVGIGAGMAIGQTMGQAFGNSSSAAPAPPPSSSSAPPPPSINAARWSVAIEGKTYGPYTDDAVKQMVQSGQLASSSLLWRPGANGWASLESYPELAATPSMPPPPPPPTIG